MKNLDLREREQNKSWKPRPAEERPVRFSTDCPSLLFVSCIVTKNVGNPVNYTMLTDGWPFQLTGFVCLDPNMMRYMTHDSWIMSHDDCTFDQLYISALAIWPKIISSENVIWSKNLISMLQSGPRTKSGHVPLCIETLFCSWITRNPIIEGNNDYSWLNLNTYPNTPDIPDSNISNITFSIIQYNLQ